MPNHRPLPLFPAETTDDVAREIWRRTHRTQDEIDHEKAARRRSKRKQWKKPAIPDGPCCGRCANWRRPEEEKAIYGECRFLGVVEERMPHLSIEKGTVMAIQDARAARVPVERLRVAAWAACSAWTHIEEQVA